MICELAGQIGGVASGKGVETHTVSSYRVLRSRPVIWCVAGSEGCRRVVGRTAGEWWGGGIGFKGQRVL